MDARSTEYIYDFFRLRNELDRNQFLLGNNNEWIIQVFNRTGLKQVTLGRHVQQATGLKFFDV